jgi:hypothetical protein
MELPDAFTPLLRRRVAPMAAYRHATSRTPADPELWTRIVLSIDLAQVIHLARETRDPFPWRVFLRLVLRLRARGDDADLARAEVHVRALARELLDLQGLVLLEPDDVVASPDRTTAERGMAALLGREGIPP